MNKEEKYARVVRMLRNNNPELQGKERLVNQVMHRINLPQEGFALGGKFDSYIFGWTGTYWIRTVMSIAALFFLSFFLVQQLVMWNRLNTLEEQMVKPAIKTGVLGTDPGMLHRTFINAALKDLQTGDSITVSKDDLEILLMDYMKMAERLEYMQPAYHQESRMKRLLRKDAGKDDVTKKSI
jgi:hypothetical protein